MNPSSTTTTRTGRVGSTLSALLARTYDTHGDARAVVSLDGTSITWSELGRVARSTAGGLRRNGLVAGDRVILLMKNRRECFELDHALFAGGFIRVALSYRLHPREILGIAKDCGARAIVMDAESAANLAPVLADADLDLLMISVDPGSPGCVDYGEIARGDEIEPVDADPEDIAWLPYTSGTTGQPKGVMVSHRALMACMRNLMVELPVIEPTDVLLHVAPLTHLSGYMGLTCSVRGATQVPMPAFDPVATLRAVKDFGVTVLPLVPTMINALLPVAEAGDHDVSSIHTILYGGSAIAPDRIARAVDIFGPVFVQGYGLTEVAFPLASLSKDAHRFDPTREPPARLASAGRITPFVELKLVTPSGEIAAAGELGEIVARGDVTMSGYWNRPSETAETLSDDGWVSTGDVGRLEEGYLHIVDRKKDMIVSGGFNIFPSEVENAISTLDGVHEVAVIGVPHPKWGESVHAVVVRRPGAELSIEDVDRVCRANLASYKTPRSLSFLDELPKTGSGKIMRRQLRDEAWAGQTRRVGG